MKHCVLYWNAQPAEGGGSFTLQPGIAPSRGILRFTPGQTLSEIGSFRLSDNQSVSATFTNCRVTRYQVTSSTNGRYAEVTFLDRRWKWLDQHYAVYGRYNQKGSLYGETNDRSPRQMAALLCQALGETGFNVTALPANVDGPPVDWDGDNPAVELGQLAALYGCVVVLSPADRVVLHRIGVGYVPRPDSRQMDFTDAAELPAIPKALVFEGGATSIQFDLPLVPVAKDFDGKYKYIRNLSYNPTPGFVDINIPALPYVTGWERAQPPFPMLPPDARALAADVWKVYAIGSHYGSFQLPMPPADMLLGSNQSSLSPTQTKLLRSYFQINRGTEWRVLPLNEYQNPTAYTRYVGANGPDAEVLGFFYRPWGAANTNSFGYRSLSTLLGARPEVFDASKEISIRGALPGNSGLIYNAQDGQFQVDWANGLVRFSNHVYFQDDDRGYVPPVLRLRTSFPLRDPVTQAHLCHQWWNSPGSPNAVDIVDVIKRSDQFFEYCLDTDQNNKSSFVSVAVAFLNEALSRYSISRGYSAPYKGFVTDISPDGIVRSVSWDVREGAGGITHIDYNMERPESYLTFQEMQNSRYANYQLWLAAQIKQKNLRKGLP